MLDALTVNPQDKGPNNWTAEETRMNETFQASCSRVLAARVLPFTKTLSSLPFAVRVLRWTIEPCETITVVSEVQIRSTGLTKELFLVKEYRAGNSA